MRKVRKRMKAKLTMDEENEIKDILIDAAIKIIDFLNDVVDDAYQDGYKDGEAETEERLKVKE